MLLVCVNCADFPVVTLVGLVRLGFAMVAVCLQVLVDFWLVLVFRGFALLVSWLLVVSFGGWCLGIVCGLCLLGGCCWWC